MPENHSTNLGLVSGSFIKKTKLRTIQKLREEIRNAYQGLVNQISFQINMDLQFTFTPLLRQKVQTLPLRTSGVALPLWSSAGRLKADFILSHVQPQTHFTWVVFSVIILGNRLGGFFAGILVLNLKIYYNCRQPLQGGSFQRMKQHRTQIKDNRTL